MKVFILFTIFTQLLFAATDAELKSLMKEHLRSIKTKDLKALKETVSNKYFQKMNKKDGIKRLFALQKNDSKPIEFDIAIKRSTYKKGLIFVNIKDKKQKKYDQHWYEVSKDSSSGKIRIDGTMFFDD